MKKLTAVLLALAMTLGIASALADSFKPGDRVYFGHYEQDGNARNGAEKICWIVLKAEGDDLMLLREKGLDRHRFHKSSDGTFPVCFLMTNGRSPAASPGPCPLRSAGRMSRQE